MNFLPEKKYGVPSHNFVKKSVLCENGDEITRFDGTSQPNQRRIYLTSQNTTYCTYVNCKYRIYDIFRYSM